MIVVGPKAPAGSVTFIAVTLNVRKPGSSGDPIRHLLGSGLQSIRVRIRIIGYGLEIGWTEFREPDSIYPSRIMKLLKWNYFSLNSQLIFVEVPDLRLGG
jgi:hypothetical protein